MAKPDWGTKRLCSNTSCAAKFYDFGRTPVVCPACGTVIDLTPLTRVRRSRGGERAKPAPVPIAVVPVPALVEDADAPAEVEEAAEEEVIEDASELGEDEDDVAEVLDTPLETEEGR